MLKLIRSRLLLIGLSVAYLFATQKSVLASRKVVIYFMTLSVVYGYILRMLYRHQYIRKWGVPGETRALVIDSRAGSTEKIIERYKNGDYECVVVDVMSFDCDCNKMSSSILNRNASNEKSLKSLLLALEKNGIRTYLTMECLGYTVKPGIAMDIDGFATIPAFVRDERFNVFGIKYAVARVEEAVLHVISHLDELKGKYICFSNVHTTVMAKEDKNYADTLNGAAFVFPDGTPIAKRQKRSGIIGVERVAGPDFMRSMFNNTQDGKISHYFYGSTEKTLGALKEKLEIEYPGINIKGMYSPPFRKLTNEEDTEVVNMINDSGADIVWVGLGAPKQERWMQAHEGRINGIMMGVGAGFDFHAGTAKRAPLWVQKVGLEWLFRLFVDPKRLFKRYLVTNSKFVWYSFIERIDNKGRKN